MITKTALVTVQPITPEKKSSEYSLVPLQTRPLAHLKHSSIKENACSEI
jgi:hypothetical protein